MKKEFIFILTLLISLNIAAKEEFSSTQKFKECSGEEIVILNSRQVESMAKIHELISQVDIQIASHPDLSAKRQKSLKKAQEILRCSLEHLPKLGYTCDGLSRHCRTSEAWINWRFARYINLCPDFWKLSPERMVSDLVHEATHKCGTTDACYFGASPDSIPHNCKGFAYQHIGSTYQYWALFGIKAPGLF
ncbi:MAG: hypothetical protein WCG27_09060 [Pseudomonadota bacterium]